MKLNLKAVLVAAVLAALAAGCRSHPLEEADSGEAHFMRQGSEEYLVLKERSIPGLAWVPVQTAELSNALEASGMVNYDPRRVTSIISRVQGRIENTRVDLWDNVRKGDPILQLYSPDLMTAEAEYLQAQAAFHGSTGTVTEGIGDISDTLLKSARLKLTLLGMSKEDLANLQEPQSAVWIRAPAGGTIVEDAVVRGSAVNPGDVLLTVGTLEQVWITADLYEEAAARLEVGQKLEAKVAAFPGEVFKGTISNISPDINPDTHTFQIRSTIANPGHRLKPRMLAEVSIFTRPEAALVVPQEALIFDRDGYYAFVRVNQGVLRRKVETSPWSQEGMVRVRSGIKVGDRVAISETIQLNALWHRAQGEGS